MTKNHISAEHRKLATAAFKYQIEELAQTLANDQPTGIMLEGLEKLRFQLRRLELDLEDCTEKLMLKQLRML